MFKQRFRNLQNDIKYNISKFKYNKYHLEISKDFQDPVKRSFSDFNERLIPVNLSYASYESTSSDIEDNEKPPVLIMHGLLGSKNNWNSLSKAIHANTNRKIITIDARNHGDSPHTDDFSYPHLAEDVHLLLSDLSIPKATVIGHSMGGRAMMYLTLKYPHLIESLIVVDISPTRTSSDIIQMTNLFSAMQSINLDFKVSLSKARKLVDEQLIESVSDVYVRQFLLTNLVEVTGGSYKWRVNLDSVVTNFPNLMKFSIPSGNFKGPVLFIGGENSDYLRREDHRSIRKIFPKAQFRYIEGAGHWVHTEKPSEFLSLVYDFLNNPE